jgi:hypothetical protein
LNELPSLAGYLPDAESIDIDGSSTST